MSFALRVQDLEAGYEPGLPIVRGASLDVAKGEILAVIGPNGAGKSTLLSVLTNGKLAMNGRITYRLQSGEVAHQGTAIHRIARNGVARKFQIPHLFDSLTVAETLLVASLRGKLPSVWRRTRNVEVGRSVHDIPIAPRPTTPFGDFGTGPEG